MNKIKIVPVTLLVLIFLSISFSQQELFIPRNIVNAYEKGTRSFDGKPGPDYWQNYSYYKIEVEVDPSTYRINGSEEIAYHNNSSDSLKRIVINLYPNVIKKGSARDYAINPDAINEGVTVSKISIDGHSINLENQSIFSVSSAIATIYLPKPVPPRSSINFAIDWNFNICQPRQYGERVFMILQLFLLDTGILKLRFMMILMDGTTIIMVDK